MSKWIARIFPKDCPPAYIGSYVDIVWEKDRAKQFDSYEEAFAEAKLRAFHNEQYDAIEVTSQEAI